LSSVEPAVAASLITLAVLLICSAIMSGSETALFALSQHQLQQFRRSGHRLQRLAAALMRDPRRVLLTVLIGNTTVNVLIFANSYVVSNHLGKTNALLASLWAIITVVLVIVVSEALAKTFAISVAASAAPLVAPLIRALELILAPVRVVLEYLLDILQVLMVGVVEKLEVEVEVGSSQGLQDQVEQHL